MPWTAKDGPKRHTKAANTPAKQRQWADVANKELEKTGDEGRAIRVANGVVRDHPSEKRK
jgi:hypothetical protein